MLMSQIKKVRNNMSENTNSALSGNSTVPAGNDGTKAQSVAGFQVVTYTIKKGKETEKLKLVLEAEVDDISSGEYNMGDVMKALLDHASGESAVTLRLFMKK